MRVAVLVGVLIVLGLLVAIPAYGGDGGNAIGKLSKKGDMVDVIIYKQPGAKALKRAAPLASVQSIEPRVQVISEYRSIGGMHARVPSGAVEKLRRQGYRVEEDRLIPLALDTSNPVILSDTAKRSGLSGTGVKVCVLDTGIDLWHTQVLIPPQERMSDWLKMINGPYQPSSNGTTATYTIYVNESINTLNFSINWGVTGNRFDFYVWYPNGTYAGGTNESTPYLSTYWWLTVNLTDVPAGYYNITTNDTIIIDSSGEWFTLYWDPDYPSAGIFISDFGGHGTHVIGTIAGNNTTYEGVAPNVTLYTGTVCDGYTSAVHGCPVSSILNGMQWCLDNNVDIISMSIGGTDSTGTCSGSMAVMADTVGDSLLPVIAAGNTGPSSGSITTPGCARKAVGVGNVNDAGSIVSTSGRGPTGDGRIKPDVVAPGNDVTSTCPLDTFCSKGGTSMATPHVSGAAAITKEANPSWTTPVLKAALMATAVKSNGGSDLDNDYGSGLIDVMQLVTKPYINTSSLHRGDAFVAYGRWESAENNYTIQSITNSTNFTMNITVPSGATSLKAVLYWEENSSDVRSQMSLYLLDPAGTQADNSSIENSTVQMVYNASPMSGDWTLNVSGDNVQGTESFVLFTSIRINDTTFSYAEINLTATLSNFSAVADNDRANYTNTTDNTWLVGLHAIKLYSNDTLDNWDVSGTAYLTMVGWAGINESVSPAAVDEGTNFSASCRVRDSNTTEVLTNYNVSFWANDTSLGSGKTNSTGWANVTASISGPGSYVLKCNISDESALFYDAAEPENNSALTVSDTTPPLYSNLANSPALYGSDWQGNSTWADNADISYVLFESNYTGSYANYSTSSAGSEYYFTIGAGNFSGGKVIAWRWVANDTSGNWNSTSQSAFIVAKATTGVTLFLNGTEGNRSYARGQLANLTAVVNVSGKYVILEANFSANYSVLENSTGTATNITNTSGMNVTEYNVTAYFLEDENYSASIATYFLNLLKANGESCSSGSECYGTCCSGSCASSCPSTTPSGGGGGAAAAPSTKSVDLNSKFTEQDSYQSTFSVKDKAKYEFKGANHTISVTGLANTTVTLTITSSPYNIILNVGETQNIDLDGEGIADIGITLNSITDSKASLTFTKLEAPAEEEPQPQEKPPENATGPVDEGPQEKTEGGGVQERPALEMGFAAVVLVIAAMAVIKLRKKPKGRR